MIQALPKNTKALQISYFRAEYILSEREVGGGGRKAQSKPLFRPFFAALRPRSRPPARPPVAGLPESAPGRASERPRGSAVAAREGGRRRIATLSALSRRAAPRASWRSPERAARARTPRRRTRCSRAASRRARSAPATRSRRPSAQPPPARPRPAPASHPARRTGELLLDGRRYALHATSPGRHMQELRRLAGQRLRRGRGDQRLPAAGELLDQHPAPVRIELREHVVEEEQRRFAAALRRSAPPPRAAAQAQPCAAPPASRTNAGRVCRPRVETSSRCGPRPVAPRSRSRSSRASSSSTDGGSPSYESRASSRPSSAARVANSGFSSASVSRRASTSEAPSPAICSVQGAIDVRSPRLSAAFRWASAAA